MASPVRISDRSISRAALSTVITGTPGSRSRSSSTAEFAADPAELFPPSCIERFDLARVGLGVGTRSVCSGGERTQPSARTGGAFGTVRGPDVSIRGETGDVVADPGGEHKTDRRHEARCEAAAAEDDVDERAAGAAVAIGERVDRLELGVGDRGLYEDRVIVAVDIDE